MSRTIFSIFIFLILISSSFSQRRKSASNTASPSSGLIDPGIFKGLKMRNLGPAKTGGRIVDIAVDPRNKSIRFAAVASGNVWRTRNAGTTWEPVFDKYGAYSIGIVEIDPNNSNIVWVGTGENNSQRSVGLGDGIYKSLDGGTTWNNMGLKTSEHIGKIVIDPRNSDVVYVASQGGLWKPGGERGLYKTTNGGESWERILHISENTGISDIIYHPRNPDILLASSYQRRRHFGMLVAGGPDGGIWKSTDAGKTWIKLSVGLPSGDLGRIGLAVSPQKPEVIYALIAGTDETKGFYRSENFGDNWRKMSDYMVIDAQYYMEIFPDPHQFDKVYSVNVFINVTDDGGKNFHRLGSQFKHVDNHEIVFDADDPNYIMVGCDGGIYETWDKAKTWRFTSNIPITQFYRVGIDNDYPFYNVYGGTQDNATLGGPSRTTHRNGIRDFDWFITIGGDGFQTRIDPDDPNIVYSQYQYAGIVRFDKKSGEKIDIQPQPEAGEAALKWNWDSPLIISPHNGKRLYFAANKLFKSDDRGNTWMPISDDLTRQLDRNKMKVMDRVWGVDAIFKNVWTSPLSTIVALDESPIQEGLIYVGTDDGLIQVSENGGQSWRKIDKFPGIPQYAYVSDVYASRHNANTVFAVFNHHKYGDYHPYLLKSNDRGISWQNISGNIPDHEFTWTLVQDHDDPNLLFTGTEYGLFFTLDGGNQWIKLKNGIPTIAIRDLEIQKRENDLVAASFGRGFYILDNYSPLRNINQNELAKEALLFPVKNPLLYLETNFDGRSYGHSFYTSPNPEYGAVFTYYLKNSSQTLKQKRQKDEKDKVSKTQPVYYPDWDQLVAEQREEKPRVVFTITNINGDLVRRITGPASKGINRVAWNLRFSGANPARSGGNPSGPLVIPGKYMVSMARVVNGEWEDLGLSQSFEVIQLENRTLPASDSKELEAFQKKVNNLRRVIFSANEILDETVEEMKTIKQAVTNNYQDGKSLYEKASAIQNKLQDLYISLNGNRLVVRKMELIPPSPSRRVNRVARDFYNSTSSPTNTQVKSYEIAASEFKKLATDINDLIDNEIKPLENLLDQAEIPYTPNRRKIIWSEN